jgi:hypothetical protein
VLLPSPGTWITSVSPSNRCSGAALISGPSNPIVDLGFEVSARLPVVPALDEKDDLQFVKAVDD